MVKGIAYMPSIIVGNRCESALYILTIMQICIFVCDGKIEKE